LSAWPSHWQLHRAARWIDDGGVIAYPTEAVYGIGCDPADAGAVARLLALKQRPADKGLILVASRRRQLERWLRPQAPNRVERLEATWPGPVTWLIEAAPGCPPWLTGAHDTLAVRVSAHPVVRRLCDLLDRAIVSTSANISTRRPARSPLEVRLQFGNRLDFVLPGPLGGRQRPTEIRDLASGRLVRE
jgi:L-threonylcarbamoyladenylate synthase